MKLQFFIVLICAFYALCPDATAQDILWDNGLEWECGSATPSERDTIIPMATAIDDFLLSDPAIVDAIKVLFMVTPPDGSDDPPGGFTGADVILYPPDIELGGPRCDTPIFEVFNHPVNLEDTGGMLFGLHCWLGEASALGIDLPAGQHWAAMRLVDKGDGRAFIAMNNCDDEVPLDQAYFDSEFFGVNCAPGDEVSPFPYSLAFQVLGFTLGEATPGFLRALDPIVSSGDAGGDVKSVNESDDKYYIIAAGPGFNAAAQHATILEGTTHLPDFPLDNLGLRIESRTTKPFVTQRILLYDFDADAWITLDEGTLSHTEDQVIELESLDDPDRFIEDDTGDVRLRLQTTAPAFTANRHKLLVDQAIFIVTYEE